MRRQGLGRKLAEWRIAEARRRFGGEGVIVAGVEATNTGSLATARKWAGQIMGPLRIAIAPTTRRRRRSGSSPHPRDRGRRHRGRRRGVKRVQRRRKPVSPDDAATACASSSRPSIRAVRFVSTGVAVTPAGDIVAGVVVVQRFELMTDQIDRLPTPLALLNKVVHLVPADGVIRTGRGLPAVVRAGTAQGGAAPLGGDPPRMAWPGDRTRHRGRPEERAAEMCRVGRLVSRPRLRLMVPISEPGCAIGGSTRQRVAVGGESRPDRRASFDGLAKGRRSRPAIRSRAPSGTRSAGAWRRRRSAWRRARSRPPSSVRRRGPPTPRDSRSPRRPAATDRTARAGRVPLRSARHRTGRAPARRSSVRGRPGSTVSPSHATGPSYPSGSGTPASPCSSAISSARTTRRGLRRSICAARVGASRREPVDERVQAVRFQVRLEPRPNLGIARERVGVEPAGDGAQVQPGSAGEDRDAIPLADRGQRRTRVADEVGHRERLVGVDEVEAVVRDASAFGGRHLGRADVQAAEDLPRVGRDDLGRSPLLRDPLGEPDREPGLAGRRRTGDDQERRRGGHAVAIVPRRAYGPAWSTRTAANRPTRSVSPRRWTSLLPRVRPDRAEPSASCSCIGCGERLRVRGCGAGRPCRRALRPRGRATHDCARARSTPGARAAR